MVTSCVCCSERSPFSSPRKATISIISVALVIIGSLALYGSFHPASLFGPLGHTLTSIGSGIVVGASLLIFIFNVSSKPKVQPIDHSEHPSGPFNPSSKPADRGTGAPGESIGQNPSQHSNVQTSSEHQKFEDQF